MKPKAWISSFQGSIFRWTAVVLCLLLMLSGCAPEKQADLPAIRALQCTQIPSLETLYPAGGTKVAIHRTDYENGQTTIALVDVNADALCGEITLDGLWSFKEQSFRDGRIALYSRENNTWHFLSSALEDMGIWRAENVDGFFSYDGSTYYYLSDHVLCFQPVNGGAGGKIKLPLDLRLLDLTAFDPESGTLVMQFFLSPYSSECGTAAFNMRTGAFTMLQRERYRTFFCGDDVCLLSFDNEKMGYGVTYGSGGQFFFADADLFSDTGGELYPIAGSPYLMGVAAECSILYTVGTQISLCPLTDWGIPGEMRSVCYLPEAGLLVGAVYADGAFGLYAIDPAQLAFTRKADAAAVASPMAVDSALAQSYWSALSGAPVAQNLQEARQYADTLEQRYGVRILLSGQCREAAALSDRRIHMTDTMDSRQEVTRVCAMLEALNRSLALYPQGFPAQFRTGAGDGGLCFLLVGEIESNYGVAGCTYERFNWQYIALDVGQTEGLDGIICHEIWHATENEILRQDYTAFPADAWDALNPQGFSYLQDATLTVPDQKWTLYRSRPEEIHFVDSYACVNQKEDRARIMEYFMTHEDEAKVLIQSPFIRRKLQMMCSAVRNTFDTALWTDVRWERLL